MLETPRPLSCPRRGEIPAFDAGWDAHDTGIDRETVEVITPSDGRSWALLGWDIRARIAAGPESGVSGREGP